VQPKKTKNILQRQKKKHHTQKTQTTANRKNSKTIYTAHTENSVHNFSPRQNSTGYLVLENTLFQETENI
jgi:hypothetical protein